MLTEAPLKSKQNQERMTQIMFEILGAQSSGQVHVDPGRIFRSTRRGERLVASWTQATAFSIPHPSARATRSRAIGILAERGHHFTITADQEFAGDIEEERSCVALNFAEEMQGAVGHPIQ